MNAKSEAIQHLKLNIIFEAIIKIAEQTGADINREIGGFNFLEKSIMEEDNDGQ